MTTNPIPLSRKDWQRIHFKPIGRCAWEHLAFEIEHKRPTTLVEARALHAPFYPNIQGSAGLFTGEKDHRAKILYRNVPWGQPKYETDPVRLTAEGLRMACLFRHHILGMPWKDPEEFDRILSQSL